MKYLFNKSNNTMNITSMVVLAVMSTESYFLTYSPIFRISIQGNDPYKKSIP